MKEMEDEDQLSVSLIPDTPSPVFARSKSRTTGLAKDESCVINCNLLKDAGQISHDTSGLRNNVQCLYGAHKGMSLPGSPTFAAERQEVVRKKLSQKHMSPFSKSKYSLSPLKNSHNKLSACKYDSSSSVGSSILKSPSKLDGNLASSSSSVSHQPKFSGFIKSSCLLKESPNATKLKHKFKKSKIETVTFNSAEGNEDGKMRKRPHKATLGWPSSSSESNDEECSLQCRRKKVLKTKSSTKTGASGLGRPGPIQYTDFDCDKFSTGISAGTDCNRNSNSVMSKKSRKRKVETTSTYDADRDSAFDEYLGHSNNSRRPSSHSKSCDGLNAICKKEKKLNKMKTSDNVEVKTTESANKLPTNTLPDGDLSFRFTSPILSRYQPKSKSGSPAHLFHHRNFGSPSLSQLSSCNMNLDLDDTSSAMGRSTEHQPGQVLCTLFTSDRPLDTNSPDASNVGGSADNPIDLDAMTPGTKNAMNEIKQLQSDEDMARQLQEELDREYAMSLQSGQHQGTSLSDMNMHHHIQTGLDNIESGAMAPSDFSATSPQQWHMYSPVRQRPARRRGGGGAPRHRGDSPFRDQILQILQQTEQMLHTELGPNAGPEADLDHMWDRAPFRRGRRRAGRRGRGDVVFGMYSPGGNGEDYEHLMNLAEMLGDVKDKGLNKADLARLPIVSYTKVEGQEDEECNICMTDYETGDSQKILPCFHSFHCKCIDKWIVKNATCPICRVEVKIS